MLGFLGVNPWVILGVFLAIVGAGVAGYTKGHSDGVHTTTIAYERSLEKQRAEAQDLLLKSKDALLAKERELNDFKDKVEKENAEKNAYVNGLRLANGRLVAAAGGLFDRNGRPSGQGGNNGVPGASGAAGGPAGPAPGCRISDEITRDLLDLARDADLAAVYAQTGHDYAVGIQRLLEQTRPPPHH